MIQLRQGFIKTLLYSLLILLSVVSVGTLFWSSYPLELLTNFRVYYLLSAVALAIACAIIQIKGLRVKFALYLALALIALNATGIVPWYLPNSHQASSRNLRVLTFNINVQNDRWDAISQAILKVNPDIATVIESTPQAQEELSNRLNRNFPFSYRTSGGGISIFSQHPLISPQSKKFKDGTVLVTSVQLKGKVVNAIAVHPLVPLKPLLFKRRNGLLKELTTYIKSIDRKPLILLGDFNLTPWSPHYSQLVGNTKLHNTRLGFGVQPSWIESATHVHYPWWVTAIVKIPIDHIFVSQDFKVSDFRTAKAGNSDHRMAWSDLVI